MRITDVTTRIINIGRNFTWGGRQKRDINAAFLTLRTDAGVEGYAVCLDGRSPGAHGYLGN